MLAAWVSITFCRQACMHEGRHKTIVALEACMFTRMLSTKNTSKKGLFFKQLEAAAHMAHDLLCTRKPMCAVHLWSCNFRVDR